MSRADNLVLQFSRAFQTGYMKMKDCLEKVGDYYLMKKDLSDALLTEALKTTGIEGYPISPNVRILFRDEPPLIKFFAATQCIDKFIYHENLTNALQSHFQQNTKCTIEEGGEDQIPFLLRDNASNLHKMVIQRPATLDQAIASGTASARQLSEFCTEKIRRMNEIDFQSFLASNAIQIAAGGEGTVYKITKIDNAEMQNPVVIKVFHNKRTTADYCRAYAHEWNLFYQDELKLPGFACASSVTLVNNSRSFVLAPYINGTRTPAVRWRGGEKLIIDGYADNARKFFVDGEQYVGIIDFGSVCSYPTGRALTMLLPDAEPPAISELFKFLRSHPYHERTQRLLNFDDEELMDFDLMNRLCQSVCWSTGERTILWNKVKMKLSELSTGEFAGLLNYQCFTSEDNTIVWNLCRDKLHELNADQLIILINYNFFDDNQYVEIWHAIENRLETLIGNVEQFATLYACPSFNDAQREQILKSVENKFCEWCEQNSDLEKNLLGWDQLTEVHRHLISAAIHRTAVKDVTSATPNISAAGKITLFGQTTSVSAVPLEIARNSNDNLKNLPDPENITPHVELRRD